MTALSVRYIHAAVDRARPDVRSVVHCHTGELIPFGVTDVALRPVSDVSAFLSEGAPVFEIRDVDPALDRTWQLWRQAFAP